MPNHILLTGVPGVGKTTLVRKLCDRLSEKQIPIAGFYTSEVRSGVQRIGFDVHCLGGEKRLGKLARVQTDLNESSNKLPRVGKYMVFIKDFEEVVLPMFQSLTTEEKGILVLDEIGGMECHSREFKHNVRKAFTDSSRVICATVPVSKGKGIDIVEELKSNPNCTLITVTKQNRDNLLDSLLEHLNI